MKGILSSLGLTDSEIAVYEALLELGESTRTAIVTTSGISGSKVYEVLDKLHKKGLITTYIQNRIKHFKPANPKQLLYYLEEKETKLKEKEEQIEDILPTLLQKFASSKKEQEVELLVGLKGLETIFREQIDILDPKEATYVIGGTKGNNEGPLIAFFKKIHLLREEKGIKTKMLINENLRSVTKRDYSKKEFSLTTTKFIAHSSPVAINIYKNHTVIIIFGESITGIHITSESVSKSFMEYFNLLWKTAKK
jgi:sugar-specific transcriptional regulator TrmB